MTFLGPDGMPVAGGRLSIYYGGTLVPADVRFDTGFCCPHPLVLSDLGAVETIVLDLAMTYRFVLQTQTGKVVWDVDGVGVGTLLEQKPAVFFG